MYLILGVYMNLLVLFNAPKRYSRNSLTSPGSGPEDPPGSFGRGDPSTPMGVLPRAWTALRRPPPAGVYGYPSARG